MAARQANHCCIFAESASRVRKMCRDRSAPSKMFCLCQAASLSSTAGHPGPNCVAFVLAVFGFPACLDADAGMNGFRPLEQLSF